MAFVVALVVSQVILVGVAAAVELGVFVAVAVVVPAMVELVAVSVVDVVVRLHVWHLAMHMSVSSQHCEMYGYCMGIGISTGYVYG